MEMYFIKESFRLNGLVIASRLSNIQLNAPIVFIRRDIIALQASSWSASEHTVLLLYRR